MKESECDIDRVTEEMRIEREGERRERMRGEGESVQRNIDVQRRRSTDGVLWRWKQRQKEG